MVKCSSELDNDKDVRGRRKAENVLEWLCASLFRVTRL